MWNFLFGELESWSNVLAFISYKVTVVSVFSSWVAEWTMVGILFLFSFSSVSVIPSCRLEGSEFRIVEYLSCSIFFPTASVRFLYFYPIFIKSSTAALSLDVSFILSLTLPRIFVMTVYRGVVPCYFSSWRPLGDIESLRVWLLCFASANFPLVC